MTDNKVVPNDEEVFFKQLYKEFKKTKADLQEYIEIIQKWADTQPHFPERPSREILRFVILYNKFSVENAKEKLDMYYSIRNLMPEYFQTNPLSADIIFHNKVCFLLPLPKPAADYSRIIYNSFNSKYEDPKNFDHDKLLCSFIHVMEYLIQEDLSYRFHYILDCKPLKLGHIAKIKPINIKKFVVIMEKVYSNRLSSICLVNLGDYFEQFFTTAIKPLLNAKLQERLKIISTDELIQIYGTERLPKDIGGELKSMSEINDLLRQEYERKKDLFCKLEKLTVDESLRPGQLKNDDILGFYGNFKKIQLD